jgi:hypothetical protein
MPMRMTIGLMTCVLLVLGCATDPAGRAVIKLPNGHVSVGGNYPMPTHCSDTGAGIPVPGTGR